MRSLSARRQTNTVQRSTASYRKNRRLNNGRRGVDLTDSVTEY